MVPHGRASPCLLLVLLGAWAGARGTGATFAALHPGEVLVDEGETIGQWLFCDLECCEAACASAPRCHSFAHRTRLNQQVCVLKDRCVEVDAILSDPPPTTRSAYSTYYESCDAAAAAAAAAALDRQLARVAPSVDELSRFVLPSSSAAPPASSASSSPAAAVTSSVLPSRVGTLCAELAPSAADLPCIGSSRDVCLAADTRRLGCAQVCGQFVPLAVERAADADWPCVVAKASEERSGPPICVCVRRAGALLEV